METTREFINRISKLEDVNVNSQGSLEYEQFINNYLSKIKNLLERKDTNQDEMQEILDFLESNLQRNVKYLVQVRYKQEEIKLANDIQEVIPNVEGKTREIKEEKRRILEKELVESNPVGTSYLDKRGTGARPAQYIQGRIVYSNMNENEDILKDHETTHAARMVIYNENDNIVNPNFDVLPATTYSPEFMKQLKSVKVTAGYDYGEIDENGIPKEIENDELMFQFMEICTESIAGMMNDKDEKTFENGKFSIPTERMSAINYLSKFRNMLIMSIGSDDFIIDMLKKDTNEGYKKLNGKIGNLKDGANVFEFLSLYFQSFENEECMEKYENYATEMFLKRMENCHSADKEEQIDYFAN